jgi:transaldolase
VTLIFSEERYREVMDAYLTGLEQAAAAGIDLSGHPLGGVLLHQPRRLRDRQAPGGASAPMPRSRARRPSPTPRWRWPRSTRSSPPTASRKLEAKGANKQRPLWASTGTKNAAYPDTLYVSDLVAQGVVNTMPEKTLLAYADHGELGAPMEGTGADGAKVLDDHRPRWASTWPTSSRCSRTEGVEKFIASWDSELVTAVDRQGPRRPWSAATTDPRHQTRVAARIGA